MNAIKRISIILSICLSLFSNSYAAFQNVGNQYAANGVLLSTIDYSNPNSPQVITYDALKRMTSVTDKGTGVASMYVVYGSNGQSITLTRGTDSQADTWTASYTFANGQVSASVSGVSFSDAQLANLTMDSVQTITDVSIADMEAAYNLVTAPQSDLHNVPTFGQALAIVTGNIGTEASKKWDWASKVSITSMSGTLLNSLSTGVLARLLGYASGGSTSSGTVSYGGQTYTGLGDGKGGGTAETTQFLADIKAVVAVWASKGALARNSIQFGAVSAEGAMTTASFKSTVAIPAGTCKGQAAMAVGEQGTIINEKPGAASNYDPLVQGTVNGVTQVTDANGVVHNYVKVSANSVDMFDGKGFQAADGEEIWVEVDAATAASLQNAAGQQIIIAGDVTSDANGHLTMTMNAGGYAVGNDAKQVTNQWFSEHSGFYNETKAAMASTWATANALGQNNDWKAGWNFLKSGAGLAAQSVALRAGINIQPNF